MRDTRNARLTLGLLLASALVMITIDHRGGTDSPLESLHGIGSSLFSGAERVGSNVIQPVRELVAMVAAAPGAQRRIDALERENARLRSDVTAHVLDKQRSDQLTRMLGVAGLGGYRVVPGQVIARRGLPGFEDTVQVDIGSSDGVRPNMTVLSADGLVGRVVRTGADSSTVVLLTDPASSAGARLEGGNEVGVVNGLGRNGEGGNLVRFRLLDPTAAMSPGHRIVSFGSQEGVPYVAGVPIGVIDHVEATPGELTRVAYARPYTDFSALDVVGVVVGGPRRDPRDSVLPRGGA